MTAIDHMLARRLVASSFPQWAKLAVVPVDPQGHDNRTFRLCDAMSLRLPGSEAYAAHIVVGFEWLPKLATHLPFAGHSERFLRLSALATGCVGAIGQLAMP